MGGRSRMPGLVVGEECAVTIQEPGAAGRDYLGPEWPADLYGKKWLGRVETVDTEKTDGGYPTKARLTDPNLWSSRSSLLRGLHDKPVPRGLLYDVTPTHALSGRMREGLFKTGDECFVWIPEPGSLAGMELPSDRSPSEFPGYPLRRLTGFWKGRVRAIRRPVDNESVRAVRAVITDERLLRHPDPRVRACHGHEPWIGYWATKTDNAITEGALNLVAAADPEVRRAIERTGAAIGQGGRSIRDMVQRLKDELFDDPN